MSQTKAQLLGPLVADDIDVTGGLNLDNGTLKVDPDNNRVGINNSDPTKTLDIGGDVQLTDLYYTADYPTIRPTLDLAFAQTKQLDSRITFTRSSTGTYVGTDGLIKTAAVDTPRFDHDPVTGESLGLLIEESRTNIQRYSSTIGGTNWGVLSGTHIATINTTIAPDGTQTASTITLSSTGGGRFYVQDAVTVTIGATYTLSCWMKTDPGTTKNIALYGVNGAGGTLFTVTDQWVRYSCQVVPINGADYFGFESRVTNASTTGNVYVWGFQVEAGTFPTSYIPTLGSSVTRSADIATITGDNLSSFYNVSEGTVFAEYQNPKSGDLNNRVWCIELSQNQNFNIIPENNQVSGQFYNFAYEYNPGSVPATNDFNKVALGMKTNDVNMAVNGVVGADDTSLTMIDFSSGYFNIGRSQYYSPRELNGTIKRLTYYPRRLNNSQLQNITL